MSDDKKNGSAASRKAVGVYERPASADRSRARLLWIVAAVAVAVAVGWMLYLR